MNQRRKTINPYARLADRPGKSPNMYTSWADGYKCGHNDGEMDERDDSAQLRKDNSYFRGVTMDQAIRVRHLTEQLETVRRSHKVMDDSNDKLRNIRDTHLDEVERLTKANRNQATTIKEKLEEAKYLRATIHNLQAKLRNQTMQESQPYPEPESVYATGNENVDAANNFRQGWDQGYEHGIRQCNHHPEALTIEVADELMKVRYSRGFDEGNEEGYADGLAEGKRQAEAEQPAWTHEAKRQGYQRALADVSEKLEELR